MKTKFLFSTAFAAMISGAALAQDPGPRRPPLPPTMRLALENVGRHRFVGTRTVEFRRDGDTVRRTEFVTVDSRLIRTEFPDGSTESRRIVVESPTERREFFPGQNVIRVSESRDEEFGRLPMMLRRMGPGIKILEGNQVTLAGRKGREVNFTDPKGNIRQQLVVDLDNGLILKRQLFDFVGTPIAAYEYTKLSFRDKIDPRLFRLNRNGAKVVSARDELKSLFSTKDFINASLPEDSPFKLEFSRILKLRGGTVLLQLYRGPAGRVSLYQTQTEIEPSKLRKFGNQDVRTLSWQDRDRFFALVGNVDAETLERLKRQVVVMP